MGQCNQLCYLPMQTLNINEVRMIDPEFIQTLNQFRQQNNQLLSQISKNSKLLTTYQEIITSSYVFFGYLCQSKDQNEETDGNKRICINGKYPNGQCILIQRTKKYIKGNFKMGLIDGKAIQKSSQWSFQGRFLNGNRNHGKLKDSVFQFQGTFQNNQISGKGKLKFKNGNYYIGRLLKGKMHGHGKLVYSNGDQYQGEFKQGKYDGDGTYVWKNGTIFKGKYKNGKKHGFGVLHCDGQKHAYCWINNEPVAKPLTYKQFQAKNQVQIEKNSRKLIDLKSNEAKNKRKMKTQVNLPVNEHITNE